MGYGYHGGGRKTDNPKTKNLNIRLSADEFEKIKKNAETENKSVSEYVKSKCI